MLSHGRPVALKSTRFQNTGIGSFLGGYDGAASAGHPVPVVWMVVDRRVASIVLTRTRFGRYVFAIGGNEEAARLAGINVARVKTFVYVITGGCAALVGFL